jgi:hypothetical protein
MFAVPFVSTRLLSSSDGDTIMPTGRVDAIAERAWDGSARESVNSSED